MKLDQYLPHFPRTPHLPWKPNASPADVVARDAEAAVIFKKSVTIEEKIDGASVGFSVIDGHPSIRNREHFLKKGFVGKTAAKKQFASIWNYYYNNSKKFETLTKLGPYSVYGEWMLMQHGIFYDRLPDLFIAYDIWNWQLGQWLPPDQSRATLDKCGFSIPCLLYKGKVEEYQQLEDLTQKQAAWSSSKLEGIYLRIGSETEVTHRFKMVRPDFVSGALWDRYKINKNEVLNENQKD